MNRRIEPKTLAPVLYAIAALLVLVPAIDVITRMWPLRPGQMSWRFGVVGLVLSVLVTPVLGLVLGIAAGTIADSRRTVRVLAGAAWAAGLLLVPALAGFFLDSVQLRAGLGPAERAAFDAAAARAIIIGLVSAPTLLFIGWYGWRLPAGGAAAVRKDAQALVMHGPQQGTA